MQDLQILRQRLVADELHLYDIVLQVGKRALEKHCTLVHDADMVTDILQLAQVVGRDEDRCAVARHVLHDKAPDLTAHDGVQTVDRLVEDQIVRPDAQCQPEGRVLLHALGEPPQRRLFLQPEHIPQRMEP